MRFFDGDVVLSRTEAMDLAVEVWGSDCYLCGLPPTSADPLNLDHYFPIAGAKQRGWREEEYNAIENIRPSHASCNREKSDQWPYNGWVFVKPVKTVRPTKVPKTPVCETCDNGRYLERNGQCPDCLLDNSLRRFPKITQMAPKDCSHTGVYHCWYCVTTLDRDWSDVLA